MFFLWYDEIREEKHQQQEPEYFYMVLTLLLLGETVASLNGKQIDNLSAEKAQALLYYLAVESDRAHRREFLAEMFWPENLPGFGRNSLKQALSLLRKSLSEKDPDQEYIISSKRDLQFNAGSSCRVDVLDLEGKIHQIKSHQHDRLNTCEYCVDNLQEVVNLYRDEFLGDFYLPDSPEFNEWTVSKREYYRRLAADALNKLIRYHESRGEYAEAVAYAKDLIGLEPWSESSHRKLIALLAARGKRSAALRQYQRCKSMMANEFDAQPTAETTALYEEIKSGQFRKSPPPETSTIAPDQKQPASVPGPEKSLSTWIKISVLVSFLALVAILYLAFFRDSPILTGSSLTGVENELAMDENQNNPPDQASDTGRDPPGVGNSGLQADPVFLNDPDQVCLERENLLYWEDFHDNQAQGWPEIEFRAQNWNIVPDPENPENLVVQNPGTHEASSYLEGYTFDEAVWRLNFYKVGLPEYVFIWHHKPDPYESKSGTVYSSDYNLVFMNDGTHFYRFAYPISDVILLGIPKTVANEVWHTIEISTYQGTLEVWLDGEQLLSYQDPDPLPKGKLGLGLWQSISKNSMVYFDNISVCELTEPFASLYEEEE